MTTAISLFANFDRPLHLLEVGSWLGSSVYIWAEAIQRYLPAGGQIFCVDPWSPYFDENILNTPGLEPSYAKMHKAAQDDTAYELFKHNVDVCQRAFGISVRHQRGVSREVLPTLADGAFDVVYIDGSHAYDDVLYDLNECRRLVSDGGILCGDDLELEATDLSNLDQVRARMNEDLLFIGETQSFHPGVSLAVHDVLGRVSNYHGFWAMRRRGETFEPVDLRNVRTFGPRYWGKENVENLKKVLDKIAGK